MHVERNDYEKAADEFQEILDITPDNRQFYEEVCCLMDTEKPSLAIESGEIAARMDPKDYHVHFHIASAYLVKNEYEKALPIINELIENSPDQVQVARTKVKKLSVLKVQEQPDEILEVAKSIIEDYEDNYARRRAHLHLGMVYVQDEKYEQGIQHLTEYIENSNISLSEQSQKSEITDYISSDENKQDSEEDLALAYYYRGVSQTKVGSGNAGLSDIQKAVNYNPKFAEYAEQLDIMHTFDTKVSNINSNDFS